MRGNSNFSQIFFFLWIIRCDMNFWEVKFALNLFNFSPFITTWLQCTLPKAKSNRCNIFFVESCNKKSTVSLMMFKMHLEGIRLPNFCIIKSLDKKNSFMTVWKYIEQKIYFFEIKCLKMNAEIFCIKHFIKSRERVSKTLGSRNLNLNWLLNEWKIGFN